MKEDTVFTTLSPRQARPYLETVDAAVRKERIEVHGRSVSPFANASMYSLGKAWSAGHSAMAFNELNDVIGHAMLDCIGGPDPRKLWFELRAAWVREDYRGSPQKTPDEHSHVGYRLYKALLDAHQEKSIFETSVTKAAWVVGTRLGMVPIRLPTLPNDVWRKTCSCPKDRTGVDPSNNVPHCIIRDEECFLRVPKQTWERMGKPTPVDFDQDPKVTPHILAVPRDAPVIPTDDIRVILSRRTP